MDKFVQYLNGRSNCYCGKEPTENAVRKNHAVTVQHIRMLHENGGKQLIFDTFGSLDKKSEKRYDTAYKKVYNEPSKPFVVPKE